MRIDCKRWGILTGVLFLAWAAQAQEFWILPQNFSSAPGAKVALVFLEGENFRAKPWRLRPEEIEKLDLHHLASVVELKNTITDSIYIRAVATLKEEGTHLIVMQRANTVVESPGEQFNAMLKNYGLDDVYAAREKSGALQTVGKELYSGQIKVLLQAGAKRDDTYKKVTGFPLEIIPERNPYALKSGDMMRFRILWNGKPAFGTRVKVWNRKDNRTTLQNIYTEKDGTMETPISNSGPWMVTVMQVVPSKTEQADWQVYYESLVFGFD